MWVNRSLTKQIKDKLGKGKVLVLYGPRRVGKTSCITNFLQGSVGKLFHGSGDDAQLREILSSESRQRIISSFSGYDTVFIDEAQRVPQVGWGLKLLIDNLPGLQVIVTGSSSFALSGQIGEPLTGRAWTFTIYPLAMLELAEQYGNMSIVQKLEEYLIYGCYPEVVTAKTTEEKYAYLIELRNSYLFKDILELENVRNSAKLNDLLKLLAFQIGMETSLNELSNSLGIAKQTVERYLDLLEKAFIIKKISGFSRNLRKEISKTSRYYFLDNGIRNAVVNSFNDPMSRNDMGMLWENFCVMERLKKQEYHRLYSNNYFWRTYDQQEVDFVEERGGKLLGFEFKWGVKSQPKAPKAWMETYENASFVGVNKENFLDFVL